jgi:hypothetical protein
VLLRNFVLLLRRHCGIAKARRGNASNKNAIAMELMLFISPLHEFALGLLVSGRAIALRFADTRHFGTQLAVIK